MHALFSAIIKDGDLELLSVSLAFAPGSSDGAEMCARVTLLSDYKVVGEENTTVTLDLVTIGDSLSVGNYVTNILIAGMPDWPFCAYLSLATTIKLGC
jgi:hypothetical protein